MHVCTYASAYTRHNCFYLVYPSKLIKDIIEIASNITNCLWRKCYFGVDLNLTWHELLMVYCVGRVNIYYFITLQYTKDGVPYGDRQMTIMSEYNAWPLCFSKYIMSPYVIYIVVWLHTASVHAFHSIAMKWADLQHMMDETYHTNVFNVKNVLYIFL